MNVVENCNGCLNQYKGHSKACKAFLSAKYQWSKGTCYGRVTEVSQFKQREKAVQDYTEKYGSRESYKKSAI